MVKVDVNAELLRWARERAGMTVSELLAKFPKLDQWELVMLLGRRPALLKRHRADVAQR